MNWNLDNKLPSLDNVILSELGVVKNLVSMYGYNNY